VLVQIYEQIQPDTKFGKQMVKNLELHGAPLLGLNGTPSLEAHRERLKSHGWEHAVAEDLNSVYRHHLEPKDRLRIEALEMFDEFEEWHLIMAHYCVALGWQDATGILGSFGFETYVTTAAAALGLHSEPRLVPLPGVMLKAFPNAD
jgi:tRNA wybutosine-synthesizing protein 4